MGQWCEGADSGVNRMMIRLFGRTYEITASTMQGRRESNQDSYGWVAVSSGAMFGSASYGDLEPVSDMRDDFLLAVVCDGMGGLTDGAEASRLVVEGLIDWATISPEIDTEDARLSLVQRITEMERMVMNWYPGSGTTLSAILASEHRWTSVHLGDSRCYAFSKDGSWRTEDHSPAEAMFRKGIISEDEMHHGPMGNILSAYIGDNHADKTVFEEIPHGWNRLVLCTDGAFCEMDSESFREVSTLATDAERIVSSGYDAGSKDNITTILVRDATVGMLSQFFGGSIFNHPHE